MVAPTINNKISTKLIICLQASACPTQNALYHRRGELCSPAKSTPNKKREPSVYIPLCSLFFYFFALSHYMDDNFKF